MPWRTEHKLRNQRTGSRARDERGGACSQVIDQQAGERANPGADDRDHDPFCHCFHCNLPRGNIFR